MGTRRRKRNPLDERFKGVVVKLLEVRERSEERKSYFNNSKVLIFLLS